jgi:hypothetical protein
MGAAEAVERENNGETGNIDAAGFDWMSDNMEGT